MSRSIKTTNVRILGVHTIQEYFIIAIGVFWLFLVVYGSKMSDDQQQVKFLRPYIDDKKSIKSNEKTHKKLLIATT
jgi:hypothetical protein